MSLENFYGIYLLGILFGAGAGLLRGLYGFMVKWYKTANNEEIETEKFKWNKLLPTLVFFTLGGGIAGVFTKSPTAAITAAFAVDTAIHPWIQK